MKAIYGIFNKKIFQINDDVVIRDNCEFPSNGVMKELNSMNKDVKVSITLSNVSKDTTPNESVLADAITLIKANKLYKIDTLADIYNVAIDYTLVGEDGQIVDSGINYKRIESADMLIPLGINEDDCLSYKIGKELKGSFNIIYRSSTTPFGIQYTNSNKFTLIINRVLILEQRTETSDSVFNDRSMLDISHILPSALDDEKEFIIIYDSEMEGYSFDPIGFTFKPRNIQIDLSFNLDNYFMVNDTTTIIGELSPKPVVSDTDILIGDGSQIDLATKTSEELDPDGNGYYSIYARCTSKDLFAKLVVDDDMGDNVFDSGSMHRQSEIKNYISDIEVGEYVVLKRYVI